MPRKARNFQQALCYHVMNRGVNRQMVLSDDQDRFYFLTLMREYGELYNAKIYHWVLMGNHYHLLMEISFDELRPFMAGIQQRYALYHHARHGTAGTFWQGRFKSKPVELGAYLVSCGRYIERNPVRAHLVDDAGEYQWSSARYYITGKADPNTTQNPFLGSLGPQERRVYAEILASGIDDEIVQKTHRSRVVGSTEFGAALKIEGGRARPKQGRPAGWARAS